MRRARLAVVAVLAATAIGAAAACSNSSSGPGSGVDLSGTYGLVTLELDTVATTATGTLLLTKTNFTANIHVTVPTDTLILLAGTYTTVGSDSIYLVPPSPFPQLPGTYHLNAAKDTLELKVSFAGSALNTVWHRQ